MSLDPGYDDVCLYFGSNPAAAMSLGNRGGGMVGCSFLLSCVSGFDFLAKRGSLTISNGHKARRGSTALFGSRLNHYTGETCVLQFATDQRRIVEPCGVRARKRGGSSGKISARAFVTSSANTFSSMRSHTLNKKCPSGFRTRFASR
jgi:hypothetical protein